MTTKTNTVRATGMLAGDVAKALGVGVQTLHYYEREGLIPAPARSASGYRLFTPELVERVAFIRKAQALGLPLGEIKEILHLAERGTSPCGRVQAALREKLRAVDARLHELQSFRSELATLLQHAPELGVQQGGAQVCAIVEEASPLPPDDALRGPLGARRPRLGKSGALGDGRPSARGVSAARPSTRVEVVSSRNPVGPADPMPTGNTKEPPPCP